MLTGVFDQDAGVIGEHQWHSGRLPDRHVAQHIWSTPGMERILERGLHINHDAQIVRWYSNLLAILLERYAQRRHLLGNGRTDRCWRLATHHHITHRDIWQRPAAVIPHSKPHTGNQQYCHCQNHIQPAMTRLLIWLSGLYTAHWLLMLGTFFGFHPPHPT